MESNKHTTFIHCIFVEFFFKIGMLLLGQDENLQSLAVLESLQKW